MRAAATGDVFADVSCDAMATPAPAAPAAHGPDRYGPARRPASAEDAECALDLGGTIRASGVAASLARARVVARAIGITRVANVTGLDQVGVPTWMAVRPLARSLSVSQGKGCTHELAQISALMEGIELHHAEHFVPRGHRRSLDAAARDSRYAHPLLLPVRPNVTVDGASTVEWVEGRDLRDGDPSWVPRDCLDIDSCVSAARRKIYIGSTNGLASGNTHDEATLHALCEVVERDQESCWYVSRQLASRSARGRLRLATVDDPDCTWLLARCAAAGLDVVVWHTAQDLGVPSFTCTLFDRDHRTCFPHRASGSGCHPYRRIALSRAITEALQCRLTHIAGGRDDMHWSLYRHGLRVEGAAGRAWADALLAETATVDWKDIPEAPAMTTIAALLDWTTCALADQGLEQVIVVDLTRSEFGIPVVHVTVPGLEGPVLKDGYTPGRRMQALLAGIA